MQATSDKTASANFTQTGGTVKTNFGADVDKVTNGQDGYAPYYQWGRKDAFRSNEYTATPAVNTSLVYSGTSATVGKTIQDPTVFYNSGNDSHGNTYNPVYYNAWNATYPTFNATTDKIDGLEKVVKTVYDPCPVGYTTPPANTFTAFNRSNCPVDGSGRKYTSDGKTLYFPYTGLRFWHTAELGQVNNIGYSALAVLYSSSRGRILQLDASMANPVYTDGNVCTALAFTVRPVREPVVK